MRVDARCALPIWACTASTRDGLVVSEALLFGFAGDVSAVAEGEIVGVALGGSAGLEAF